MAGSCPKAREIPCGIVNGARGRVVHTATRSELTQTLD